MFNQTLHGNETTEVVDEGLSSDDDYTSGGDSTGTGHISTTTSEFDDENTDADLIEVASAPDTEETGNNTAWTDFDTKKDLPGREDDEASDDGEQSDTAEPKLPSNSGQLYVNEEVVTPTSPEPPAEIKRTFTIPLPPDDVEAPTRPWRDPDQVAQSRLPFMTPIAERTESSMGTATMHKQQDYFSVKTPCPKNGQRTPIIPEAEGEPFSSPFQEALDEVLNNQHPIPRPNLDRSPLQPMVPVPAHTKSTVSEIVKDSTSKGPIIKDKQCNPTDESIRRTILNEMHPPMSSFKGFFDRGHETSNRRAEIKKYCRSLSASQRSKSTSSAPTLTLPPILNLEDGERQLSIKRELGAGAFAPVYLVEPIDDESGSIDPTSNSLQPIPSSRGRLEAVKMEEPPSSWEFYILRACSRRLGVSRAADSIIDAYEMHLFRDEAFLVLEYRDQGTLLDLVNACVRENAASGSSGAMDEMLAMFFTVELLRTVEGLHSKGIIHGDLKPDNVMVRFEDPATTSSCTELASSYDHSGAGGWSSKGVSLIDFGRGIDMRAFGPDVRFIADWETGPTDCAEMRELRPWTFQADYHGLAAIVHVMLYGKYIDTVADKSGSLGAGATKTYRLRESLKRYWHTELWGDVFNLLLNSGREAEKEEGARLPALRGMRGLRERIEAYMEEHGERGVGLRGLVWRAEGMVGRRR